jgi:hypothetical protein
MAGEVMVQRAVLWLFQDIEQRGVLIFLRYACTLFANIICICSTSGLPDAEQAAVAPRG